MKYHDEVKKYFTRRVENVERILRFKPSSCKPGTFHKLRVEIKKVNAVFQLVNFCEKDFKRKKAFKPFKFIFKKAAEVRDLQMEETLFKKNKINLSDTGYVNRLKTNITKSKGRFHKAVNKNLLDDLNKCAEEAPGFISKCRDSDINAYFKKNATEIDSLQHKLKREQLHELRKKLKTFYYNLKSISAKDKNLLFKKIDALQELLGVWHDCRVPIHHFNKAIDGKEINASEIKQLNGLKSKLELKSKALVKKINSRKIKFDTDPDKNFQER